MMIIIKKKIKNRLPQHTLHAAAVTAHPIS